MFSLRKSILAQSIGCGPRAGETGGGRPSRRRWAAGRRGLADGRWGRRSLKGGQESAAANGQQSAGRGDKTPSRECRGVSELDHGPTVTVPTESALSRV
jgi:hypothetical protein